MDRSMRVLAAMGGVVLLGAAAGSVPAAERPRPPTRGPTEVGTPPLIAAGPDAERLARAAFRQRSPVDGSATNPTEAPPGVNPPLVDGNFLVGPTYVRAPEWTADPNVPSGRVEQFSMESKDSKFFNPGIARDVFGTVDPQNPKTLVVDTHPIDYRRTITVYVPQQIGAGKPTPFMVTHDGPGLGKPDSDFAHLMDNLIAAHRIPAMVVVMIAHGGGDAQGHERGREYDTLSGKFAEFIEAEVLPLVEKNCGVKLSRNPDSRAVMGNSSGGAAALAMAWYHPDWYHRVISYSGTYVNQQWPFDPKTPDGAWDFHENLIPNGKRKPLRLWLQVGDRDLLNPNVMRDGLHDWVVANNRMAKVLRAKGYHYQYVFSANAGHVDREARGQTLPEALEYAWQGYSGGK